MPAQGEKLADLPHLTIRWDESCGAVWMEWKAFAHGDKFRAGLDDGLSEMRRRKSHKWLADLRKLGVISPDDETWINDVWFPRACRDGIRFMAVVMPVERLPAVSVEKIMTEAQQRELFKQYQVQVAYFDTVEAAREWLARSGSGA